MARPPVNLTPYKRQIISWIRMKISQDIIIQQLERRYNIHVSLRTLQRRIDSWNAFHRITTKDTPYLRSQIAILFRLNCTDEEIALELGSRDISISVRAIERIRKELGLLRRMLVTERVELDKQVFHILKEELDQGAIEGYGRGLLHIYFKKMGYLVTRYVKSFRTQFPTFRKQIHGTNHTTGTLYFIC
jgi:hypothetical protein